VQPEADEAAGAQPARKRIEEDRRVGFVHHVFEQGIVGKSEYDKHDVVKLNGNLAANPADADAQKITTAVSIEPVERGAYPSAKGIKRRYVRFTVRPYVVSRLESEVRLKQLTRSTARDLLSACSDHSRP
jgi:hypothetical protein